jgi:glycosyltransferase involved in cell wall biosynthesis
VKPRVLFVARTRYGLPLSETLQRRFDALAEVIDWRQLATSATGHEVRSERFALVGRFPISRLDGFSFYGSLPHRIAREIRTFHPDIVIVQGAEDTALALAGRRLARSTVPVVFDVQGDWRHNTRVYGARGRRLLTPAADALGRIAVRRADAVRTISGFTTKLVREQGVEPIATFPTYMDLAPFTETPPAPFPTPPTALFIGVLERYKGVDVLADAWRELVSRQPGVELHMVGEGRLEGIVKGLVADQQLGVRWTPRLTTPEVAAALDAATLLVLPSRSEGMGRVIIEAFCRGRAVVGTSAGGILDLVEHDVSGLLVPVEDAEALATALGRVLSAHDTAARLGAGALAASKAWVATPVEFAARVRALVDAVLARPGS